MSNIVINKFRVGYVPISGDFESPGDSRRFIFYSKERNISVEIADINCSYDCVVLSQAADLSIWRNYKKSPIVIDFIDSYYALPKHNLRALMRGLAKFLARKSTYLQLNYWAALEDMCKHSAAVVCATDEQKHVISSFNKNIHVILDAHNFFIQRPKTTYKNSFPLKLVEKFFGKLAFKTGAMVSLSPPVMEPRLAQPIVIAIRRKKIYLSCFFCIPLIFKAQNNNYI